MKDVIPERDDLLKLPKQERFKALSKTVTIYHLGADPGDEPILSEGTYLLRFPIDMVIELLKGLHIND